MKKPVIVVGYLGNMGRRYTAILDSLDVPWYGLEWGYVVYDNQLKEQISELPAAFAYHSLIIATPTSSHIAVIKKYKHLNIPMLCEKPVCKTEAELEWIEESGVTIAMINQYEHLAGHCGESSYNYFKTGNDGLEWDCINIIGLATTPPVLRNNSPIWTCLLNGKQLKIDHMDHAYVSTIKDWLKEPKGDLEYIKTATKNVLKGFFINEKNTYRHTSKVDVDKTPEQSQQRDNEKDNVAKSDRELPTKRKVPARSKRPKS